MGLRPLYTPTQNVRNFRNVISKGLHLPDAPLLISDSSFVSEVPSADDRRKRACPNKAVE